MSGDDFDFPHIHSDIAWSHFLAQHVGKAYTEAYVTSFYPPLDALDSAEYDLLTKRWIETAQGLQLDGIGSIVGLSRELSNSVFLPFFGFVQQPAGKGFNQARIRHDREPYATSRFMGDVEYQKAIITKIALNNAHGTANDIITNVNFALGVTGTTVMDMTDAEASVLINDLTITTADPRFALLDKVIPRAAGVRIWPELVSAGNTFGFQNQVIYFGFNVGILARSGGSNISAIADSAALDISFLTGSLDPRITFTRASVATYFNSSGILATAATNTPRFGYDPITHAARGLLIEEQRQNMLFNSSSLNNFGTTGGNLKTPNATTAPDGSITGTRLTEDTGAVEHFMDYPIAIAGNTIYTFSCFVKANTRFQVDIALRSGSNWVLGNQVAVANLTTETISGVTNCGIDNVGNGWYRIRIIGTTIASPVGNTVFRLGLCDNSGNTTYTGDGTSNAYFWGAQLEAGPSASSYISTGSGGATRSMDVASMPLSGVYNATQSTFVSEFMMPYSPNPSSTSNRNLCGLSDGTTTNCMTLRSQVSASSNAAIQTTVAGTNINSASIGSAPTAYTVNKMGGAWQGTTVRGSLNGGAIVPTTTGRPVTINLLTFGNVVPTSGQPLNGFVRRVQYWQSALSNAALQQVTT